MGVVVGVVGVVRFIDSAIALIPARTPTANNANNALLVQAILPKTGKTARANAEINVRTELSTYTLNDDIIF